MFDIQEITAPRLERTGLDGDLTDEERSTQEPVRGFAAEVVRPAGIAMDKQSPEDVVAPSSSLWDFLAAFATLGLGLELLTQLEPRKAARLFPIITQKMCWERVTKSYRKIKGKWLIAEERSPVPVDLATGKADFASKP